MGQCLKALACICPGAIVAVLLYWGMVHLGKKNDQLRWRLLAEKLDEEEDDD